MSFTREELAARRLSLGASEIASVVGLNPYRSVHETWMLKRGLVEEEDNVKSRIGQLIEPVIAQVYREETGAELAHFGTVTHATEPWATATPDGFVFGIPRLLEIKCVGWRMAHHWTDEEEGVPDYYRVQGEWQCLVTGAQEVDFAALIGGTDFRIYRCRHDAALGAMLLERGRWLNHVRTGTPPAVDHSDGAREMLRRLYPRNTRPLLPATSEVAGIARALLVVRRDLADLSKSEATLENRLRAEIQDAEGYFADDFRVTYRANKNGVRALKLTAKEAA